MTDRPIIFGAPMVRALLDGHKTQTRRVLKPQPPKGFLSCVWNGAGWDWTGPGPDWHRGRYAVPRYAPGDRLWVREAWKPGAWRTDGRVAIDYRASPEMTHTPWCPHQAAFYEMDNWADEAIANGATEGDHGLVWEPGKSPLRWRSPIHMPRWASRLTLTVTDVRMQRLQEISEEDAWEEGVETDVWDQAPAARRYGTDGWFVGWPIGIGDPSVSVAAETVCRRSFETLWNSLHGPEAWDANPWVAAISFTVQRGNIDEARP